MRIFQAVLAMCALAACTNADASNPTFTGSLDESEYQRLFQDLPHDQLKAECEAIKISYPELIDMIDAYQKLDAASAYMVLEITPCRVESDFIFKGRAARFLWYPSGYLAVSYPGDEEAEGEYYICLGSGDEEGVFSCDEEQRWDYGGNYWGRPGQRHSQ